MDDCGQGNRSRRDAHPPSGRRQPHWTAAVGPRDVSAPTAPSLTSFVPARRRRWIDLPSKYKLTDPSYQELTADKIPSAHPSPNVLVKVICGTAQGSEEEGAVSSPVRPLGGCWFFDVQFSAKGEQFYQEIPKGWNAFVSCPTASHSSPIIALT